MPNNGVRTSLLYQLAMDYDSSDSEKSTFPSPQDEALSNSIQGSSSIQTTNELVDSSIVSVTVPMPSQQTENVVDPWSSLVNFSTSTATNPSPQNVPQSTFQTSTSDSYIGNISDNQNQIDFVMDSALPNSSPSGQNIFIPSSFDFFKSKQFSFADNAFTTSDLYSDLMIIDSNIYGNAPNAELNRDVDPAQHVVPFSCPQQALVAQDSFLGPTFNAVNATNVENNNELCENPASIYLASSISSSDMEVVTSCDIATRSANDSVIESYPGDDVLQLKDALERSRQEVKALSDKNRQLTDNFEALNKKYKDTKTSSVEIHESKKRYKNLAQQRENELKVCMQQNKAFISHSKAQLTKINTLTQTIQNLQGTILIPDQQNKDDVQRSHRDAIVQTDDDRSTETSRGWRPREVLQFHDEVKNYIQETEMSLKNQQDQMFSLFRRIKNGKQSFNEKKQYKLSAEAESVNIMHGTQERSFVNTTRAKITASCQNEMFRKV